MEDLKKRVEALLFSAGKRMNIGHLAGLCKAKLEDVKKALFELKIEYERNDSSLMLIEDGDFWKLAVREQFLPIVEKIVTETELSKTVLETLAVIAFKYPILQSDLIKIRTNKAYDHMAELEAAGYITRQKQGRTKLIKLTDKFFEYFDLPRDKLREQFKDFGSIAKAIEDKETEIEHIKVEQRKNAEEMKKEDETMKQAAENADKPLETYESKKSEEEAKPKITVQKEKLGSLDVVEEPSEEDIEKERERIHEIKEEDKKQSEEKEENKEEKKEGIKLTDEMEKKVDKRAEEIMNPEKEDNEGKEQ